MFRHSKSIRFKMFTWFPVSTFNFRSTQGNINAINHSSGLTTVFVFLQVKKVDFCVIAHTIFLKSGSCELSCTIFAVFMLRTTYFLCRSKAVFILLMNRLTFQFSKNVVLFKISSSSVELLFILLNIVSGRYFQ